MSDLTRVLLVDDNSKYLKDALPFYGYEVKTACDGVQALKELAVKNNKFDIVLLDVMMPNMNGWETLKAIRRNEHTKHLPVIMLTAVNEEQKMVTGLKIGADDYIVKPFVLPNLLARMEAVLRRFHPPERNPTGYIRASSLRSFDIKGKRSVTNGCKRGK